MCTKSASLESALIDDEGFWIVKPPEPDPAELAGIRDIWKENFFNIKRVVTEALGQPQAISSVVYPWHLNVATERYLESVAYEIEDGITKDAQFRDHFASALLAYDVQVGDNVFMIDYETEYMDVHIGTVGRLCPRGDCRDSYIYLITIWQGPVAGRGAGRAGSTREVCCKNASAMFG